MDTRGDRQPGQGHPTSESTWAAAQTQRLYLQSHIILPKMLQQLKLLNADFSGITQIFVKVNSERKWLVIHPSFSVPIIRLSCGFLRVSLQKDFHSVTGSQTRKKSFKKHQQTHLFGICQWLFLDE